MINNKAHTKPEYRKEIGGLRAFAVILATIYNFNKDFLPSAYLGVDVFAVISGYVITSSISGRGADNLITFLNGFFFRRIKRLLPALIFFVGICSIITCLINPEPQFALKTGAFSLVGLSNIYLAKELTDYFSTSSHLNPFIQTWSLGMEQQFYFFFPVIAWMSGLVRLKFNSFRNLSLIISTLSIFSLIGFIYLYQVDPTSAYYLMPSRFWEMGSGCLAFLVYQGNPKVKIFFKKIPAILIIILMIMIAFLPLEKGMIATILIVLMTFSILISIQKNTFLYSLLTGKYIQYIGEISYSIYLWRWALIAFFYWTIGIHWWSLPFQIILLFYVSKFSYDFIEKPFNKKQWFLLTKYNIFSTSLAISSLLLSILGLYKASANRNLYVGSKSVLSGYTKLYEYVGNYTKLKADSCFIRDHKIFNIKKHADQCSFNYYKNSPLIAVIGSSHSLAMFPTIEKFVEKHSYNSFWLSKGNCPFPEQGLNAQSGCQKIMQESEDYLVNKFNNNNSGGILVISNNLSGYFGYKGELRKTFLANNKGKKDDVDKNLENYVKALERLSFKLKNSNTKIIVISPIPEFIGLEPILCKDEWFRPFGSISKGCKSINKSKEIEKNKHIFASLQDLENRNKNIFLFNGFDVMCPNKLSCSPMINKEVLYLDYTHISPIGADLMYSGLEKYLTRNKLLLNKKNN